MPTLAGSTSPCVVCKEKPPLYRCPKCFIKYCSLTCYKSHQVDICIVQVDAARVASPPATQAGGETGTAAVLRDCTATELLQCQQPSSGLAPRFLLTHQTDDTVPVDVLQRLGESPVLKEMLRNEHLVTLVRSLDSSAQPDLEMSRAMQEPIFAEFATQCLNIVEPRNGC